MKEQIKGLAEKWKAENEKLKADYVTLEAAEAVIGMGKLEDEKLLILRERGCLQGCIIELQNLLFIETA